MFDEEPDRDPHGECANAIRELQATVATLRAQLAQVTEARDCYLESASVAVRLNGRLERELAEAREQWAFVKDCNATMYPLFMRLRVLVAMPAEGESAVVEAVEKMIATLRAQLEDAQCLLVKTREIATTRVVAIRDLARKNLEEAATVVEGSVGVWQLTEGQCDVLATAIRALLPAKPAPVNQCDGCRRGLPKDEHGNHYVKGHSCDMIGCTAHLYVAPTLTPEIVRECIARSDKDSAELDVHLRQTFTAPDNDVTLDSCGYPHKEPEPAKVERAYCECDLRARAWNPSTGCCETCGRTYRVSP